MILQIRRNVFETNSSSTHTLTICTQDEYKAFQNGELVCVSEAWGEFDPNKYFGGKDFVSKEEVLERVKEVNKERKAEGQDEDLLYEDERFFTYVPRVEKGECQHYWEEYPQSHEYELETCLEAEDGEYYNHYSGLESYCRYFTTPSGDKMVAFGEYGYDG